MKFPNQIKQLSQLVSSHGHQIRIVGGYVRDYLMGFEGNEIDLATTMSSDYLMRICEAEGFKVIPTGLKHGTITVIIQGQQFEITTLRKDVQCDGRHAIVEFTDNWLEDARRRDFTINSIYSDVDGKIYDYFNGQEDLKNQTVKFIGDPSQRIAEDYLRIMRYFRFLGYFKYDAQNIKINIDSLNASVLLSDNLQKISAERIRVELLKMLGSRSPHIPVKLMLENNIFSKIYLDLEFNPDSLFLCKDPVINLTAMLKLSKICSIDSVKKLKFSNKEQKRTLTMLTIDFERNFDFLLEKIISGDDISSFLHNKMQELGKSEVIDLFNLYFVIKARSFTNPSERSLEELLGSANTILNNIHLKAFPVNGHDLIKLGFKGYAIGEKLDQLKNIWIESDCSMSKSQLLDLIDNL